MAKKYALIDKKQEQYLEKIWPGPVTVVLAGRNILPTEVAAGKDTIAIRLPKNELLGKIISELDAPLISTSLNYSGSKEVPGLDRLDEYFIVYQPDLVINAGPAKAVKASKLIDLTNINNIKILRD